MKNKICTECGHIGKPIPQKKSSFAVDAVIWMIFVFGAGMSQFLPLLLVPLAWSIYHIVRFNSVKCPACESLEMVSLNSRRGKAMERDPHPMHIIYKAGE